MAQGSPAGNPNNARENIMKKVRHVVLEESLGTHKVQPMKALQREFVRSAKTFSLKSDLVALL